MDDTTRVNLIKELAKETGMLDPHGTKYSGSYYDTATGTFYCEGIVIPRNRVEKALEYFKKQMYACKDIAARDSNMLESYCNYAVACNAIMLLHETATELKKLKGEDKKK